MACQAYQKVHLPLFKALAHVIHPCPCHTSLPMPYTFAHVIHICPCHAPLPRPVTDFGASESQTGMLASLTPSRATAIAYYIGAS
eukprot:1151057-Pelagomonas_calceolata.AAC.3